MAVELKRLIDMVKHKDITLVAGGEGENSLVTWVHMVENSEAAKFLEGNEIAILTGVAIRTEEKFVEFVEKMIEKNISAIIVNIGPYIEKIPEQIIQICEKEQMPLYTVPWKIHLAEIIRILCYNITKEEQKTLELSSAFKNAILFPKEEEIYVIPLSRRNYHVNWKYSVGVIKISNSSTNILQRIDNLCFYLDNHIKQYFSNVIFFPNDTEIVMVMGNFDVAMQRELIEVMNGYLSVVLNENESYTMGMGRMTKSVRCLYKSYAQAKAIQRFQDDGKLGEKDVLYSDLGAFKLLLSIDDQEVLQDYYDQLLGPLEAYDEKNDSDLCEVLQVYLEHNGSVKETADQLYVHRNTINYKINKIEKMLDIDLASLKSRIEIMTAFSVKKIIM